MFRPTTSVVGLLAVSLAILCAGCRVEKVELPASFEPNLVHAKKYEIQEGFSLDQTLADANWVTTGLFGTPDDPKIPKIHDFDDPSLPPIDLEESPVDLDNLIRASGPPDAEGRGLFRKHCAICHGVTGNGRGPTAAVQIPYPRDYRLGIFKFKSTPRGAKPTRGDLKRLIADGIPGTAMNKIAALSDADVEALVDYVIYLSWRGEVERSLIDLAVSDMDLAAGERIRNVEFAQKVESDAEYAKKLFEILDQADLRDLKDYVVYLDFAKRLEADPDLKTRLDEAADSEEELSEQLEAELDAYDTYQDIAEEIADDDEFEGPLKAALEQATIEELTKFDAYMFTVEEQDGFVLDGADSWLEAEDEALEVPDPPAGLPVAESYKDFQALAAGDQATQLAASVERGKEIFLGKVANCSKCHGKGGLGDGQTDDYDDWTKDWTLRVGLKPTDTDSLIPLMARGALPPLNAVPRNFQAGIFRGGSKSTDLYRRITQGIDGTPMPAATISEGQFEQDDVWHLINFIRSLQTEDPDEMLVDPTEAPAA